MDTSAALYRPPKFIAGLDIGQQVDPTALCIMERQMLLDQGTLVPRFDTRYLERLPLQTPYPVMVKGVRERLEKLGDRAVLVIDATGVGRAVTDQFRDGWHTTDSLTGERLTLPGKPTIIALTITNAEHARSERWDEWYVPKRDLIMTFMVALQQRRFRVAAGLKEAEMLFKEGQGFQWKVSKAGNDLYGAWREGQHDDLLLACAIAVWWGERYAPRSLPSSQGQAYAIGSGNPLRRVAGGRR
jgi:hypothetical protein